MILTLHLNGINLNFILQRCFRFHDLLKSLLHSNKAGFPPGTFQCSPVSAWVFPRCPSFLLQPKTCTLVAALGLSVFMSADGCLSPSVSVINWQPVQGVISSPDARTSTTSSWGNQLGYLAINQQQQQQQQEDPESTTEGRAFFCSSNSPLCSDSVQPIIFRPVISACWDSMTPPVSQGYAFFFLCTFSDSSATNQLKRLLLFLTRVGRSTHCDSCAATFSQTLTTEALSGPFHSSGYE